MQDEFQSTEVPKANATIGVAILCVCFLCLGWLASFTWLNRVKISDLLLQASQQKYLTMTGEIGPVTYWVQHTGYQELEASLDQYEDILGIEVYEWPDKAAIAFSRADTESISLLKDSPYVIAMKQQLILMMCH